MNESVTEVFVKQPLASPESANHIHTNPVAVNLPSALTKHFLGAKRILICYAMCASNNAEVRRTKYKYMLTKSI